MNNIELTDKLLSFAHRAVLLNSNGDYDDYLCESKDNKYCITTITYEYNEPQINYQTEWLNTELEAKRAFKKDMAIEI